MVVIVGALVILPDSHQSADFVFTEFVNNTGWDNSFYVVLLGLLLAQYTFTGYDASAHMTEETHDVNGPPLNRDVDRGVAGRGWVLLIGVTFATSPTTGHSAARPACRRPRSSSTPSARPAATAARDRGRRPVLLRHVVGDGELADGLRFAHDGALPASSFWHKLNTRTRTPTNAIWLAAVGAFLLGLPYLWNVTAYAAVTSIAVIGLYIAYVLPTSCGCARATSSSLAPTSGAGASRWATIAVAWVAFITVLFMLPQVSPITRNTFNYTPIALVVLGFAGIWWVVSARTWFKGTQGPGHARGAGHRSRPGAGLTG